MNILIKKKIITIKNFEIKDTKINEATFVKLNSGEWKVTKLEFIKDSFYIVHIYANYLLITLVILHILAVIAHHFIFKDKILKKIL